MLYIDEAQIEGLLNSARRVDERQIDAILLKARSLKRLTLAETAALLAVTDQRLIAKIFAAASFVKNAIYGTRVVLFAPLYISNICQNQCLYCAFKADNAMLERRALTIDEIREQTALVLASGHKRILMVAGESSMHGMPAIDYYCAAMRAIYDVRVGQHAIKRVNVNCAPLSVDEFKRLKAAGIGTYQVFQETYHEKTYRHVHPAGPKSDPDNRIDAIDRAFRAGIDDVGIGVLYGLYDYRFETLALLAHVEHLEKTFNVGPHTISVPRIEPAVGVEFVNHLTHKVSDEDFKKVVAVLRLAVPYTGIILSTRETPAVRDELFGLGISQISAASRTAPGGYAAEDNNTTDDTQFKIGDQRSLDEVIGSLIERGFVPSFCAACYRRERTGEAFMKLARPGTIKDKCTINALITLKEYLDDFASAPVRAEGTRLIERVEKTLSDGDRQVLKQFFAHIDHGARDEYI